MELKKALPTVCIIIAFTVVGFVIAKFPRLNSLSQKQTVAAVADCQQRGGLAVVKTSGFFDQYTDSVICYGTALGRITYDYDSRGVPPPLTPEKEKVTP